MTPPVPTLTGSAVSQPVSPWSCHSCRRRKTRCDRRAPCTQCVRAGLGCGFPSTGKLPTVHHHPAERPRLDREKQTELLDRLTRLEKLVDDLSTQIQPGAIHKEGIMGPNHAHNQHHIEAEAKLPQYIGRLVNDRDGRTYMGNRLWTLIYNQLECIREAAEDTAEHDQQLSSDPRSQQLPWTLPFLWSDSGFNIAAIRPLPSQISFLWDVFVERMDPFIKVLHVPSMSRMVRQTAFQHDKEPGIEALIIAISLAAVASLAEDEVTSSFGEAKADLLSRFSIATEQALSRANVLNTSDMNVIRAFLIYLETMAITRGTRAIWSLNGLLIRAAQSVGLHRDSTHFSDVSPFETEMRRRLWWHICFLDSRVSGCQVSEVSLTEDMFDTLAPSNLNDEDISPDMASIPDIKGCYTDASLSVIRCNLWCLLRRVQSSMSTLPHTQKNRPSQEQLLQDINDTRDRIRRTCLRSESSESKHVFAESLTQLQLNNMEIFVRCHNLSEDEALQDTAFKSQKDECFLAAISGCESTRALLEDDSTRKWAWVFQEYILWPALSAVLMELCNRPWGPTCERAWTLAEQNSKHLPRAATKQEVFYAPLVNLLGAARRHREAEFKRLGIQTGEQLLQQSEEWQSQPTTPYATSMEVEQSADNIPMLGISVAEERSAIATATSNAGSFLDVVLPAEICSPGISGSDNSGWDAVKSVEPGLNPMCSFLQP